MDREEILESVRANVEDKDARRHMLATEAIMRALARKLGRDEDEWGLTGLLHDIDVELVEDDPESHSKLGADIARELGATAAMSRAILCHNEAHGIPRRKRLDKALFCAAALSRLITAAAVACPDRLEGLTVQSVEERFHEGLSDAGAYIERTAECRQIGLKLDEFVGLGLKAMKGIAAELDLQVIPAFESPQGGSEGSP